MRYANLPFRATLLVSICLFPAVSSAQEMVTELRITTLSTMLTDLRGVGEWGYAALVETNHGTILFDTGERPGTVLENGLTLARSRPSCLLTTTSTIPAAW